MTDKLPEATHAGAIRIADKEVPCYVLEDGTRVLSRAGVLTAIGRAPKAKGGRKYDEEFKLPVFLTANNLKDFISKDLIENSEPVHFTHKGRIMIAFRAELLTNVCEVFLDAEDKGVLRKNQEHIARACKALHRGFARIGVIGLVDEATGYQAVRNKNALQEILDKYLQDHARKWAKTFPDEFWIKLLRVKGYPGYYALKRPAFVGHWVNDIVYDRLAPGIRTKLDLINPRLASGRRKNTHHQHTTEDHGLPELKEHLTKVMVLMDASSNDTQFQRLLNRSLQKYGNTIEMPLDDES